MQNPLRENLRALRHSTVWPNDSGHTRCRADDCGAVIFHRTQSAHRQLLVGHVRKTKGRVIRRDREDLRTTFHSMLEGAIERDFITGADADRDESIRFARPNMDDAVIVARAEIPRHIDV